MLPPLSEAHFSFPQVHCSINYSHSSIFSLSLLVGSFLINTLPSSFLPAYQATSFHFFFQPPNFLSLNSGDSHGSKSVVSSYTLYPPFTTFLRVCFQLLTKTLSFMSPVQFSLQRSNHINLSIHFHLAVILSYETQYAQNGAKDFPLVICPSLYL